MIPGENGEGLLVQLVEKYYKVTAVINLSGRVMCQVSTNCE